MDTHHFDALVIGFGKGGKTLAAFLSKQGWHVAVVEQSKKMYGGTCINIACIPTKSLLLSAEQEAESHLSLCQEKEAYYQHSLAVKDQVVSLLRQKNYDNLHNNPHITLIDGKASFLSPQLVHVELAGSGEMLVQADKIFINTGSLPSLPSIEGLADNQRVYTSTSLMELEHLPQNLVIIGSGYVGLEFASMYQAFGSRVTVVERFGTFLPRFDRDIATAVQHTMEKQGIRFLFNVKVQSLQDREEQTSLMYSDEQGEQKELTADAILVATGRRPNTEGLHLENAGIEVNEHGYIKVNEFLQTNVPAIWALGDINGGPQFTYISLDDFRIIRDQLFGNKNHSARSRRNIPFSVFLLPTLAHIGLTEEEALREGHEIKVATLPAAAIPRAQQLHKTEGLLKAVIDAKSLHILGCTLYCAEASEVINVVQTAMNAEQSYMQLRDNIFTHPSMSEALNDLFSQMLREGISSLPKVGSTDSRRG